MLSGVPSSGQQFAAVRSLNQFDDRTVRILSNADEPTPIADGGTTFREGVYRAADSDAVTSYRQIDRTVQRIDGLDGTANTRAKQLVRNTDGDGIRLIDELSDTALDNVLNLEIDRASELRTAFARKNTRGHAEADDIGEFANLADNLEGTPGLNSGPVDDVITAGDPGNVQGALREVRRADEIGSENIQRMSLEAYDGNQRIGELDIQRTNGEIVESKSSFGYTSEEINTQFERKLQTMKSHNDVQFDGNTLEVRASQIGDENLVQSKIVEWENKVADTGEWANSDVTIEVVDESTDTTITS